MEWKWIGVSYIEGESRRRSRRRGGAVRATRRHEGDEGGVIDTSMEGVFDLVRTLTFFLLELVFDLSAVPLGKETGNDLKVSAKGAERFVKELCLIGAPPLDRLAIAVTSVGDVS